VKTVCAWCNEHIRGRGKTISHGICRRCVTDLRQPRFEFMNRVPRLMSPPRTARRNPFLSAGNDLPVQQDFLMTLA
jgi:hypothetical protein